MSPAKKKQSTIAKLPENSSDTAIARISNRERDAALLALIKKGGKSARPKVEEERVPQKRISLRIPEDMAERIKNAAKVREIKTSVHSWLVEAVLEKLKKEGF